MAETNIQIRNFYNQKPIGPIYYLTLEIYHPAMGAVRFVNDFTAQTFTLESSAPRDGGQAVEFTPLNFNSPEPDQDETSSVRIRIDLGRVGSEAKEQLKRVNGFGYFEPVQVIYRKFISTETSGPVKVYILYSSQVSIQKDNVSIVATDDNPSRQNVSRLYQFGAFPGLEVI